MGLPDPGATIERGGLPNSAEQQRVMQWRADLAWRQRNGQEGLWKPPGFLPFLPYRPRGPAENSGLWRFFLSLVPSPAPRVGGCFPASSTAWGSTGGFRAWLGWTPLLPAVRPGPSGSDSCPPPAYPHHSTSGRKWAELSWAWLATSAVQDPASPPGLGEGGATEGEAPRQI